MTPRPARLDRSTEVEHDPGASFPLDEVLLLAAQRSRELHGGSFTSDEGRVLVTLVAEIVGACEQAHRRRDREQMLMDAGVVAGLALIGGGVAAVLVAMLAHLAAALPLAELPARAGVGAGVLAALAGLVLVLGLRRHAR